MEVIQEIINVKLKKDVLVVLKKYAGEENVSVENMMNGLNDIKYIIYFKIY